MWRECAPSGLRVRRVDAALQTVVQPWADSLCIKSRDSAESACAIRALDFSSCTHRSTAVHKLQHVPKASAVALCDLPFMRCSETLQYACYCSGFRRLGA